jgi:hypothetical protein
MQRRIHAGDPEFNIASPANVPTHTSNFSDTSGPECGSYARLSYDVKRNAYSIWTLPDGGHEPEATGRAV